MKYRILKEIDHLGTWYIPQRKVLFWWITLDYPFYSATLDRAKKKIEVDKKKKVKKDKEVVWTDDYLNI